MGQDVEEIRSIVGISHREKKARAGVETCTMLPLARSLGRIGENLVGTLGTLHQVVAWIKLRGKIRYFSQKIIKDRSQAKCCHVPIDNCWNVL